MNINEMIGKIIQFNTFVEQTEIDFEKGQKARIVRIDELSTKEKKNATNGQCSDIELLDVYVDFSEFEEENKKLATPCYFNKNGPMVCFHEKGFYPVNCKTSFVIDANEFANNTTIFDLDEKTTVESESLSKLMGRFDMKYGKGGSGIRIVFYADESGHFERGGDDLYHFETLKDAINWLKSNI